MQFYLVYCNLHLIINEGHAQDGEHAPRPRMPFWQDYPMSMTIADRHGMEEVMGYGLSAVPSFATGG